MTFSKMKLQVTNAVRAYFNRNWTMEDLMDSGEITQPAYAILTTVYLTLFCAMSNFTFGYFFHLMWEAGGLFTLLFPMRTRISLLMYAACNLGASFGIFTDYFPKMSQKHVFGLLASPTLGIGVVCFESLFTRDRREIYMGCLICTLAPMFCTFVASNSDLIDSHATHYMLKVCTVVAFFLGYIVVYNQEIVYDAQFGEIDFLNRTINIFLDLPAIVVHAVRVAFLGAEIELHRQN